MATVALRIVAHVDDAQHLLCADSCPCHNFDDDNERVCGAFDRILYVPDDEPEDEDGNLLTERCPECLAAVLTDAAVSS